MVDRYCCANIVPIIIIYIGNRAEQLIKGENEHGDESAALALDGTCCHDGRNVTSESHYKWYERLAVKSHLVHQLVHNEGCACHIAAVLHERYEEVEDEDLGEEHYY